MELLRPLVPEGMTLAQFALAWILSFDAVTCAIPGAKNGRQAMENAAASGRPPVGEDVIARIRAIYDERIRDRVHHRW